MRARKILAACWMAVPLLTVMSQACMKKLANGLGDAPFALSTLWQVLHSPWVLGVLVAEIASFVLWLRVLSVMQVGRAVPLSAVAYILVLSLGWFGFHEPIYPSQLLGSVLILGGVWLLSSSPTVPEIAHP